MHSYPLKAGPLVSAEWLAANQSNETLVILDGSFKLPGVTPVAKADYARRHIPGALFFDIDEIADHSTSLPHMLPSEAAFADAVRALGISNDSFIVVYDTPGLMSAARVWWTFRAFGHERIAILDGGLTTWIAEGRTVSADVPVVKPGSFRASFRPEMVVSRQQVLENVETKARQTIDARSAARFHAIEKEARPGLRSGHIPGSLNLPFNLITIPETGKLKARDEIAMLFQQAGFEPGQSTIATCGSGVTACALVFGLHLVGKDDVAVYDGAWTEWGMPGDTPVAA